MKYRVGQGTRMVVLSGEYGAFNLWIEIDEANVLCPRGAQCSVRRGTSTRSIQGTNKGPSQRTLSASYLAAGRQALKPGKSYNVRVRGRVEGTITTLR